MLPDNLGNCNVSKSDNVNEHETSFSKTDNNYWPPGTFAIAGDSRLEYMLKVDNRNTRARCEICSKLTIKTPKRLQCRRSGVFIMTQFGEKLPFFYLDSFVHHCVCGLLVFQQ